MDLSRWISHRAEWSPERIAIRFEGEAVSYAALDGRIERLAAALAGECGVGHGDRVAYLGLNSPLVLELLFACARLGAILAPLSSRLAVPEHAELLRDCAPRVLVADHALAEHGERSSAGLPHLRVAAGGAARDGWRGLDALVSSAPAAAAPRRGAPEDDVLLVYTSGTTGRAKGAVLTQAALAWNAVNSTAAHDLTSADHVLTVLPMFHVGGLNIHTTPALHAGACVTIHRRFDAATALRAIGEDRPTLFLAVPPVSLAMTGHPSWPGTDVSSLRLVATGSSVVPEAVIRPWLARGVPVTQVYGLTESAPVAICLPAADAERKIGSCGVPAVHCEARVVRDDGGDAAPGERGEIRLRGPNLFREYRGDPAATAAAFDEEGWLRTGDVGHRDAEGFFRVDDRKKDVVISGGENVYPAELEAVLAECADVLEAAVVGRPDERWGEVPVACVVPRPGSRLDARTVLALFEGRLARFKHPRDVVFVAALPRNVMGKVRKDELRERLRRG